MAEQKTFIGRVTISHDGRYGTKTPYLVEVWDDDENEREERLEQSFSTAKKAERYAKSLTDDTIPQVPLTKHDEAGRWSAPIRIKGVA